MRLDPEGTEIIPEKHWLKLKETELCSLISWRQMLFLLSGLKSKIRFLVENNYPFLQLWIACVVNLTIFLIIFSVIQLLFNDHLLYTSYSAYNSCWCFQNPIWNTLPVTIYSLRDSCRALKAQFLETQLCLSLQQRILSLHNPHFNIFWGFFKQLT